MHDDPEIDSLTLTLVRWYCKIAAYLGDNLIYFGDGGTGGGAYPLLTALGYRIRWEEDIPTHNIPFEYDVDVGEGWQPPLSLRVLQEQQALVKQRLRIERIAQLRKELVNLLEGREEG